MNPGILTSGHAPPPMPYGLLGRQTPVPSIDHRVISDPRVVPGLAAWWDASDPLSITLNGSNVSQWNDKSGNGFHLTQTTAANQPLYSRGLFSGLNAVTFGPLLSATHRLINASLTTATPTIVCAMRLRGGLAVSATAQPVLFDTYDATSGRCVYAEDASSTTSGKFYRGNASAAESTSVGCVAGTLYAATFIAYQIGGDAVFNGTFGSRMTAGTNGFLGISVGNIRGAPNTVAGANGFVWDGDICEMMVFSSPIPDQRRRALERYLANKWGAIAP